MKVKQEFTIGKDIVEHFKDVGELSFYRTSYGEVYITKKDKVLAFIETSMSQGEGYVSDIIDMTEISND